jgi:hypothetical protein
MPNECLHLEKLTKQNINYYLYYYSQTCVQRPPLGLEKSGRLKEGPDKSEI